MNQHVRVKRSSWRLSRTGEWSAFAAGVLLCVLLAPAAWGQTVGDKVDAVLAAEVTAIGTYFPRSAKLELCDGTIVHCPWKGGSSPGYPTFQLRIPVYRTFLNLSDAQIKAILDVSRRSNDRFWSRVHEAEKVRPPRVAGFEFIQAEKNRLSVEFRSVLRPVQFQKAQAAVFRMMLYWDGLVGALIEAPRDRGLQSAPIGKALGIRAKQIDELKQVRREFQDKWEEITKKGYDTREDMRDFERAFTERVLDVLDVDQRAALEYWLDLSSGLTRPSKVELLLLLNLRDASDEHVLPPEVFRGTPPTVRISWSLFSDESPTATASGRRSRRVQ